MKIKLFLSLALVIIFLIGCSSVDPTINVVQEVTKDDSVEKIEVYHFHSTRQCNVCKTIGNNLDVTIERYFLEEVKLGKLAYGHINVQDFTTKEITDLYGATGTSLWIGVYDQNGFHAENDQGVWYKLEDDEAFILYLKELIEKRLVGDMS